MTKNFTSSKKAIRMTSVLLIIFLVSSVILCGNKAKLNENQTNIENDWWSPIIQKHNIDLSQFNYKATFNNIDSNNFIINKWLELGNDNGSDEKYIKLKDVLILQLFDTINIKSTRGNYWILSVPSIFQSIERNTIDYEWGKMIWYDIKDTAVIPLDSMESYGQFDFNYSLKIAPGSFRRLNPRP